MLYILCYWSIQELRFDLFLELAILMIQFLRAVEGLVYRLMTLVSDSHWIESLVRVSGDCDSTDITPQIPPEESLTLSKLSVILETVFHSVKIVSHTLKVMFRTLSKWSFPMPDIASHPQNSPSCYENSLSHPQNSLPCCQESLSHPQNSFSCY